MKGLVLEGGGAKGAYQAGAIKALNKRKIYFDAVVGTSIGSVNAAFYASKKFDKLYQLWLSTGSKVLFGIEEEMLNNLANGNFSIPNLKKGLESVIKIVKNEGIDTTNMRAFLNKHINEKKLRSSDIDFGLVTFNISEMKPVEIYKADIPEGKITDYIMASSYLPFFKFEKIIDNKYYLDGGIYSQCPISMFETKDYKEIYVIKAWRSKLRYKAKKGVKVHVITPKEDLKSIMAFTHELAEYRMNLGYYDTLKYIDKLDGNKYYFKPYNEYYYKHLFDTTTFKRMTKKYGNPLLIKNNKEFIISMIEKVCMEFKINRFKVHDMPYLITKLKYKMVNNKDNHYYDFIKKIKVDFE
ncbi:MAG: patatin-like phospholipase family protein [Tenericutes bacterium]|nr:patatin-like phospholipase family protein [Mycoplasmatota bacterium]